MKAAGKYLFHEEQSFRQNRLMLLVFAAVLPAIIFPVYGMYQQLYLGKPWGDNPTSDGALIITSVVTIVIVLLVALLMLNLKLITEVRTEGFYYRFPILINSLKEIRKDEISHCEVGKYHPIREFGGWGIRFRPGRGRAYNVKGNEGVKLFLKNGKMVLFGTQQPYEMKRAIDKMMNHSNL